MYGADAIHNCKMFVDCLNARTRPFKTEEERVIFNKSFYGANNQFHFSLTKFIVANLLKGSPPKWAEGNNDLLQKIECARRFYKVDPTHPKMNMINCISPQSQGYKRDAEYVENAQTSIKETTEELKRLSRQFEEHNMVKKQLNPEFKKSMPNLDSEIRETIKKIKEDQEFLGANLRRFDELQKKLEDVYCVLNENPLNNLDQIKELAFLLKASEQQQAQLEDRLSMGRLQSEREDGSSTVQSNVANFTRRKN